MTRIATIINAIQPIVSIIPPLHSTSRMTEENINVIHLDTVYISLKIIMKKVKIEFLETGNNHQNDVDSTKVR